MSELDKLKRALDLLDCVSLNVAVKDGGGSCILSSLIVRDFLIGVGVPAQVKSVGILVRADIGDTELYSVGCGGPSMQSLLGPNTKQATGGWDGHLVVTAKGILIDPSFGHFRRPAWNWTPDMAFVETLKDKRMFTFKDHTQKRIAAIYSCEREGGYSFSAVWLSDPGNADWMTTKSALPERRDGAVQELVQAFKEVV